MKRTGPLQAFHVDPDDGTRVDAGFLASGSMRIFAALHSPSGTPRGGLVICPPLHAAFSKNYRNEVLLGRALSREGIAVLRFHYRGLGHSDGEAEAISLGSLQEDALTADQYLRSTTGVARTGFLGCHFGSLIAAVAASGRDGAPLVLWDPVVDSVTYLREASRARLIGDLTGGTQRAAGQTIMEQLRRDGSVDIHGYPIHRRLIESLEGKTLSGELGDRRRPILLIQMARTSKLRREFSTLVSDWSALGSSVTAHTVDAEVAWWFRGPDQNRERLEETFAHVVDQTVEWMRVLFPVAEMVG